MRGVVVQRFPSIRSIPSLKSLSTPVNSQLELAITHLGKLKAATPRTQKTLLSTLHALFKKELTEAQLSPYLPRCVAGNRQSRRREVSYDTLSGP